MHYNYLLLSLMSKESDILRKAVILISAFISLAVFLSCRRNSAANDRNVYSDDSLIPESVMSDSLTEDADTLPPSLNLTTTEEILDYIADSPDRERYEKGIIPQMARDVPEYASKLMDNQYEGFLIVDKNTMKLYRYDRFGVEQERVGIACAKPYGSKHKRADNRTPEGYFTIEGIYDSTEWLFTDDDGNTSDVKGQFGPRFMRLRTPVSSQIGIHGTSAPWSIGGRRTHGCIRMTNENILRFVEICKPGWPVIVSPGQKDMRVNAEEGYDIPSVAVIPGKSRCKPYEEKKSEATVENEPDGMNPEIDSESETGENSIHSSGSTESIKQQDSDMDSKKMNSESGSDEDEKSEQSAVHHSLDYWDSL